MKKNDYEYYPPKFIKEENPYDTIEEIIKNHKTLTKDEIKNDEDLNKIAQNLIDTGVATKKDDYEANVSHPSHYADRKIEVIDYIEDCGFGEDFCLGNVIKYVSRAGKKDPNKKIEDLQKAQWYLNRCIETLLKNN